MRFFILFVFLALFPTATAETVLLSSDNPFDRAAAEVFAEKIGAKLVITEWGSLSEKAVTELLAPNVSRVYIIGDSSAVPSHVELLFSLRYSDITASYRSDGALTPDKVFLKRLIKPSSVTTYDTSRYETAMTIAQEGWTKASKAYVVHGYDELGLEMIKAQAKSEKVPILYYNPYHIPGKVRALNEFLNRLGVENLTMVSPPEIKDAALVSNYGLEKTGLNASHLIKIDKKAQAERAIKDTEIAIMEVEAGLENTRKVYETRATPKAMEPIGKGIKVAPGKEEFAKITWQGLRLRELENPYNLRASKELLDKAKKAYQGAKYAEAFVLANNAKYSWVKGAPTEFRNNIRRDVESGYLEEENATTASEAILRATYSLSYMAGREDFLKWQQKDEKGRIEKLLQDVQRIHQGFKDSKAAFRSGNESMAMETAVKNRSEILEFNKASGAMIDIIYAEKALKNARAAIARAVEWSKDKSIALNTSSAEEHLRAGEEKLATAYEAYDALNYEESASLARGVNLLASDAEFSLRQELQKKGYREEAPEYVPPSPPKK